MSGEHGYVAEDTLERLCYSLFSADLVLRSPTLLEESGAKELTDILVLIDDTAVIIQSKSMQIDLSEIDEVIIGRIINRQNKAKKQINTTLNAHRHKTKVRAQTPLDIAFELDWSAIKTRIGIITLNIPDNKYKDPEYRFQYPGLVEEHKGIIVHTFLINDLKQLVKELTTPADTLLYLKARYECIQSGRFVIGNELDFLAFYKTQYHTLREVLDAEKYSGCFLTPGLWEQYRDSRKNEIHERQKWFMNSIPYDRLIHELVTGVEHSVKLHSYTHQESALNYMKLVGKLNKLTRMERAEIGGKLLEKFDKTKNSKWGYFIYINTASKIAYLFLILNEDDREKRQKFLHYLSEQACHKISDATQLVGLATNGAAHKDHSIDSLVIENMAEIRGSVELDEELTMFKSAEYKSINEWRS